MISGQTFNAARSVKILPKLAAIEELYLHRIPYTGAAA
jgi:hypothetical protein